MVFATLAMVILASSHNILTHDDNLHNIIYYNKSHY